MDGRNGRAEALPAYEMGGVEVELDEYDVVVEEIHDGRLGPGLHSITGEIEIHRSNQLHSFVQLRHNYLWSEDGLAISLCWK